MITNDEQHDATPADTVALSIADTHELSDEHRARLLMELRPRLSAETNAEAVPLIAAMQDELLGLLTTTEGGLCALCIAATEIESVIGSFETFPANNIADMVKAVESCWGRYWGAADQELETLTAVIEIAASVCGEQGVRSRLLYARDVLGALWVAATEAAVDATWQRQEQ